MYLEDKSYTRRKGMKIKMEAKFKSKTISNYYTGNPDNYILSFHHYNIVVDNDSKEEYYLLEKDIELLRKYNKENSNRTAVLHDSCRNGECIGACSQLPRRYGRGGDGADSRAGYGKAGYDRQGRDCLRPRGSRRKCRKNNRQRLDKKSDRCR